MIRPGQRIRLFQGLVRMLGRRKAKHVAAGWREVLRDRERLASLLELGHWDHPGVDDRGASLPALDLARIAGARSVVMGLLALAGITNDEITEAIEELTYEQGMDGSDGPDQWTE